MSKLSISSQKLKTRLTRLLLQFRDDLEFKEVIANTGWQVFEKVLRLGSALLSGILVARYLQPEQYGTYNYALAFTSFFIAVSNLGANQIFVKDLITSPEHNKEIVSTAFTLRIVSGIFFFAIASGTSLVLIKDSTVQLLVIIFSLQMILKASEAIEFFFQSRMEYKYITCSKSLSSIVSVTLIVAAVTSERSIFILAMASVLECLVSLLLTLKFYKNKHQTISFSFVSFTRLKKVLSDSWPLIFSGFAITVYMRIDQIMISRMSGSVELGLYSAVVQLTEAFYLLPIAFIQASFPKLIKLKEKNEQEFYTSLQDLYNKVSLMGYVSILFVSLFPQKILSSLYGETYLEAAPVLSLSIWSVIFVTLGVARSSFIIAMNFPKFHLKTVVMASVINVVLNFFLISEYGAFGAALSTVISYWFATHGACFFFQPLRKTGNMITKSLLFIR